jgi:alkylated DNA repair dioxygenase AlkB
MDLFSNPNEGRHELISRDGKVIYFGRCMSNADAESYFHSLYHHIQWENDKALMFGKLIFTKRKVAWYGDKNFEYTYSKTTKKALPWTPELLDLKIIAEKITSEKYNSCLLNLYHDGAEGMAWRSDGEKDLKKNGAIASFSFGAERKFSFKHKLTKELISLQLEPGSVLLMTDETQSNWLHRLPPTKKITTARINLTFRTIVE